MTNDHVMGKIPAHGSTASIVGHSPCDRGRRKSGERTAFINSSELIIGGMRYFLGGEARELRSLHNTQSNVSFSVCPG